MADMSLGGPVSYYRGHTWDPNAVEAVRRWDSGIRVTNLEKFERKIVGGTWKITYKGTNNVINGMDVMLTDQALITSLTTDRNSYPVNEKVYVSLTAQNGSSVRLHLRYVVEIKDPNDRTVYDSHPRNEDMEVWVDSGSSATRTFNWKITDGSTAGTYQVNASLRDWDNWDRVYDYRWGNNPGPSFNFTSSSQPQGPSSNRIRFDVTQGAISASLSVECGVSDTNIQVNPGSSKTISFDVKSAPGEVGVTFSGQTVSKNFDTPLGTISIPAYSIGVATANVDITGRLDGTVTVAGPASVDRETLSWSGWGSRSIKININPDAMVGDSVRVTLSLRYTVDIGVSVSTIIGNQTIANVSAAQLSGSPPITTTGQIVQKPKGISLEFSPVILIGVIAATVVITMAIVGFRKSRK
jgi:hypothetical protein